MAEHRESEPAQVSFPHRVLDGLTAINLLVGSLRTYLQQDPLSPETIEECLVRIEQGIMATAALAQDMQAREVQAEERSDRR